MQDDRRTILGEKPPLGDLLGHGLTNARDETVMRSIARFEAGSWIADGRSILLGTRKGNEPASKVTRVSGIIAPRHDVPSGVRTDRHKHFNGRNASLLVAIAIDFGNTLRDRPADAEWMPYNATQIIIAKTLTDTLIWQWVQHPVWSGCARHSRPTHRSSVRGSEVACLELGITTGRRFLARAHPLRERL